MVNVPLTSMIGASDAIVLTKVKPVIIKKIESEKQMPAAGNATKLSTLSRQLSESAVRADHRDNSMSRNELGEFAKRVKGILIGDLYQANKAKHNREVPDTSDPELLERAKKATDFLTKKFAGDYTGENPFAGLSREQLTAIVYDEGGPYTVNERRAAWGASREIEQQWRSKTISDSWVEGATGGKTPNYFTEVLAHYRSLPLIEQAQYPEDYEAKLQAWLDDALSGDEKPEEDDFLTLVDIIAKTRKPEKKTEESDESTPAAEPKTNNLSPDASPTPAAVPRS
ncbi:hypothetical protein [Pseudomonas sp. NA-150]|uniref:hypothetical protein n=1 Tax=Pseudomonas sp. NA-150 TaxID=3367525 RepID=UPI0037C57AEA